LKNDWIKKEGRVCFLNNQRHEVSIPKFINLDTAPVSTGEITEIKEVDVDGFFEILNEIAVIYPSRPIFDIITMYFKPVCPESLIDPFYLHWALVESSCKEYGWTVQETLDNPDWLLETFNFLTTGRNQFARKKDETAQAQIKSAGKSKGK
jgi:hypothetical protein